MARLCADENLPFPTVTALRELGHDVVTIDDAGLGDRSLQDEAVLDIARADGRAVVTLNRWHFVRLHAERPEHAGIVVCTFDRDFVALARRIDNAVRGAGSLDGQLVRVNRPGA